MAIPVEVRNDDSSILATGTTRTSELVQGERHGDSGTHGNYSNKYCFVRVGVGEIQ
jgi:hypothetical protein